MSKFDDLGDRPTPNGDPVYTNRLLEIAQGQRATIMSFLLIICVMLAIIAGILFVKL